VKQLQVAMRHSKQQLKTTKYQAIRTLTDRRRFLRGMGMSLALPMLESFDVPCLQASTVSTPVKRLVCVGTYLGFHQADFFPKQTGKTYDMPYVLEPLVSFRDQFSVFSGLDHRGRNGHEGWQAWLSGSATGSVSMDQLVAEHVGHHTRYASLQLTCGTPPDAARLSFSKEGVPLPMIGRPSVLFQTLFRSDSDRSRMEYVLKGNGSLLDGLLEEATSLKRRVSHRDQGKLDEYLTSLRDVEKMVQKQEAWLERPFPTTDYTLPAFDPVSPDQSLECEMLMYDLMALALGTDSTRVLTFLVPGWSQVFEIDGRRLSAGYHGLSHHGNEARKIADYNLVGREHVKRFSRFLEKLQSYQDPEDRTLLDSTAVVFGSGMGDSNTHDNSNLPVLVAGGGLSHGNHWANDRAASDSRLLGDLMLTLMQRSGMDIDQFAGASRNLNECLS
jgi:hypothetical protein